MMERQETQDGQVGQEPSEPKVSGEVLEKPARRRFDAAYKMRILAEADGCAAGELGALLRREGLYSSHLATWRKLRDAGGLDGLKAKKRGRKPSVNWAERKELERLRRDNARLGHRLKQAETIIEFQKKIAEMLGNPIEPYPNEVNE